jgi:O-succinylbenzoic acid--CoA ligase
VKFLAFWVAAAAHRLILANPDWQQAEWQQVADLVQPDLSVGTVPPLIPASPSPPAIAQLPCPAILIPTGGSSGHLKFAIHTWETLSAAVQGLQDFLQLDRINSCCVLPLYHVSGLMQAIRCLITGGTIVIHPWQNFKAGILPPIEPSDFLLSLVPTQLSQLFDTAATQPQILDFLQSMPAIFLGGAPAWPSLLDRARQHALPLAPTYGMTETAGQIATLKPAEFLAGKTGCGKPLSHAQITIVASQAKAAPAIGKLQIQARSQMLGYFPSRPSNDWENAQTQGFCPDDLGYFDAAGDLHILGRNSDKIISGGENIFPAEVEAAIRATGLIADVCVIGLPDDRWGEIVAAVIVATVPQFPDQPLIQQLQIALTGHLSQYKHPRRWLVLDQLPRNAQGKLTKTTIQSWLKRTVAEG